MNLSKMNVKAFLIALLCMIAILSMSYAQSRQIAKLVSQKSESLTPFKKAFGKEAGGRVPVGLISNRSTRFKTDSLTFAPKIDQYKTLVEIGLNETQSIVNGQKLKHSVWETEFTLKGYETLSAKVKNADFDTIKITQKNGVIFSVTLLRGRNDYLLFE